MKRPDAATVRNGAAKLVELTRVPAWHADLEEFAHSGFWFGRATRGTILELPRDPSAAVTENEEPALV